MLGEREREVEELKGLLLEKDEKMDTLLKRVARVLATNTNYAAMITTPQYQRNKLKFIQLSKTGKSASGSCCSRRQCDQEHDASGRRGSG